MIALQEELDWQVYGSYGLLTDAEVAASTVADLDAVPEVKLGERAFEIVLARKVAAGETETVWFERHGSTPITELPDALAGRVPQRRPGSDRVDREAAAIWR